jgi:hypothetical protein
MNIIDQQSQSILSNTKPNRLVVNLNVESSDIVKKSNLTVDPVSNSTRNYTKKIFDQAVK